MLWLKLYVVIEEVYWWRISVSIWSLWSDKPQGGAEKSQVRKSSLEGEVSTLSVENFLQWNIFWVKKMLGEEVSKTKECEDWKNLLSEEVSWMKKCLEWRSLLSEEFSGVKKSPEWRIFLSEEVSWVKKSLER